MLELAKLTWNKLQWFELLEQKFAEDVFREGAKFIETGAGHSGTGAVTYFNTVN